MASTRDWLVAALVALYFPGFAQAEKHYIWCGANGTGSGVDFVNAYRDLPSSLIRGDSYYIAGSTNCSYGYHAFDDPLKGTAEISIVKATSSNSGAVRGWRSEFGHTPAMWLTPGQTPVHGLSFWYITKGHYSFDGQYGAGTAAGRDVPGLSSVLSTGGSRTYVSGYGFYLESWEDGLDFIQLDGPHPPESLDHILFRHIEANGVCITANMVIRDCQNAPALSRGSGMLFLRGRPSARGNTVYRDVSLEASYGHDIKNGYMALNSVDGVRIDHDQFSRSGYTATAHGNGIGIGNSNKSIPIASLTESGNTVTAVLAAAPDWPIDSPIGVYNTVPVEYSGNFRASSIRGNTITYVSPISGLPAARTPGRMTFGFVQRNITISNTNWQDVCGTSVITNMNGALTNLVVSGNTFSQTTLSVSFDGAALARCNGIGQIGDLGTRGFGAITTGAKIYNNTFVNASTTGVSGVQYNDAQSTGIDQRNNLVWGSQNVHFMNSKDGGGTDEDSHNTVINSTTNFAWTGCKEDARTRDFCVNTTGVPIGSSSSRTANGVDLKMRSVLAYKAGDPLIVIGSRSAPPRFACGLDTVYPFPPATKVSGTEARYVLRGPDIAPGTCLDGYGEVLNAAGVQMPFVSLEKPFDLRLMNDSEPYLNDGADTSSSLASNVLDATGARRGGHGRWDRGAYQLTVSSGDNASRK